MEKTVEVIVEGVVGYENIGKGKYRISCTAAEVRQDKIVKLLNSEFDYIDFKYFIKNSKAIMAHEPRTKREEEFKKLLDEAITAKVKNFYCSRCDPHVAGYPWRLSFEPGYISDYRDDEPYYLWEKYAKEYDPKRNSRLGTRLEYVAFLGVLMQRLVESGERVKDVWDMVCNDSTKLGNYWNPELEYGARNEPTGSREICGFCDLANAQKILARDEEEGYFWLASGSYARGYSGSKYPLANIESYHNWTGSMAGKVGWIVLSE